MAALFFFILYLYGTFVSLSFQLQIECPSMCECEDLKINCVRKKLRYIPKLPNDVTHLKLSFNLFERLDNDSFQGLYNLRKLVLSNNKLMYIGMRLFDDLNKLEELYLNSNSINSLDEKTFDALQNLHVLSLSYNMIKNLDLGTFKNLKKLKVFAINNNLLTNIEGGIFEGLTNLKQISLEHNKLTYVSAKVFQGLNNLQRLFLQENEIQRIEDGSFANLQNLEKLRLSYNEIKDLDLGTFGNLKKLKSLAINNNQLTNIKEGFFEGLTNLKQISLKNNKLIYVSANIFHGLNNLQKLFLQENEIQRIEDRAFANLQNLNKLYLQNNKLKTIPPNMIQNSDSIMILNLKQNNLKCDGIKEFLEKVSKRKGLQLQMDELRCSKHKEAIPEIEISPPKMFIDVGGEATFTCVTSGVPRPTVTWKHNYEKIGGSQIATIINDYKLMSNLTIQNIEENDVGIYECTGTNTVGSKKATANLIIETEVSVNSGESVNLRCSAEYPQSSFTWFENDIEIPNQPLPANIQFTSKNQILIINSTSSNDTYRCYNNDRHYTVKIIYVNINDHKIDIVDKALKTAEEGIRDAVKKSKNLYFRDDVEAQEVVICAEIYYRALELAKEFKLEQLNLSGKQLTYDELLKTEELTDLAQKSCFRQQKKYDICSDFCLHNYYRTISGSCNNVEHPTWGSSMIQFERFLSPFYENRFSQPLGWNGDMQHNDYYIPSAYFAGGIVIDALLSVNAIEYKEGINQMALIWGKWLAYDINSIVPSLALSSWNGMDCKTTCDNTDLCFPIMLSRDTDNGHQCYSFTRSSALCNSTKAMTDNLQLREQINQQSSYIDASHVYGYNTRVAEQLRDLSNDNGLMKIDISKTETLLPKSTVTKCSFYGNDRNCSAIENMRGNELSSTVMHTIWIREHNRITEKLKSLNPSWYGDKIYQEARKIVGAQIQVITYNHWLNLILGPEGYESLGIYKKYDSDVDPTITNIFATAAIRFGDIMSKLNPSYYNKKFNAADDDKLWKIFENSEMDTFLRGLFATPQKLDKTDAISNIARAADIIQRGRDHGLPPYTKWRQFCKMMDVNNFDDLKYEISNQNVRIKLENVYHSVHNIDVWVGGMLEDPVAGGTVGPLFRCILQTQFQKLRDGDRFWYENPSTFKLEQLQEIKKSNLGRVLCDNSHINNIVKNTFKIANIETDLTSCKDLPAINLSYWKECEIVNNCSISASNNTKMTQNYDCAKKIEGLEGKVKYLENKLKSLGWSP